MIPKTIWQTCKTSLPPLIANRGIATWLDHNPNYTWYYFDDDKCRQFIQDHYDSAFCNMYDSLPLGVMRADVWRVAVVYIYGGIYADIDTCCLQSADTWIDDNTRLVVGVETPIGELNNYIFAAEAYHPALLSVLECFLENFNSTDYLKDKFTPVQNFGANAFSRGILKYYGQDNVDSMTLGGQGNYYNTVPLVQQECTKFYLYDEHRFSPYITENTFVEHQVGSTNWKYSDYASWRDLEKELINK